MTAADASGLLAPGTTLGSYEIIGRLGAGGMGEVYRARDPRLDRQVAVKIIAAKHADDPAEHTRFAQEARTLASLSHPNILNIFDFGEEGEVRYAVTELLHGQTLRARMNGAAIPWRTVVPIGMALARGLAAAHAKGVIHRDMKPDNVFLLRDGGIKILDFGLARLREASGATFPTAEDEAHVGTKVYMAPEQVVKKGADERSDIFALGTVLYEALTGSRPFERPTVGGEMLAIVNDEPRPIAEFGRSVPPALERVVLRCLEKDPAKRFQTALDVAIALTEVALQPIATPSSRRDRWVRMAVFLVGLAAGAALTVLALSLF